MIASSADTAELPLVREPAVAPVLSPSEVEAVDLAVVDLAVVDLAVVDLAAAATPVACRADRRNHRLQAARERQRYAAIGVAGLAAVFGAAVAVLDVVH
jgi:hypothetical protein